MPKMLMVMFQFGAKMAFHVIVDFTYFKFIRKSQDTESFLDKKHFHCRLLS